MVAEALRERGLRVVVHDDHFPQATDDETWLPVVGARGWVLLTKDERLRRDSIQREILLGVGVRAFVLSDASLTGPAMAAAYVAALPRILKIAHAHRSGLIAHVTPLGGLRVTAIQRGR